MVALSEFFIFLFTWLIYVNYFDIEFRDPNKFGIEA